MLLQNFSFSSFSLKIEAFINLQTQHTDENTVIVVYVELFSDYYYHSIAVI